jgi:hypothetical protein
MFYRDSSIHQECKKTQLQEQGKGIVAPTHRGVDRVRSICRKKKKESEMRAKV